MNCDFRAYVACTNFRRGLLQKGRQTGVGPLKFVIIHHVSDILRCVAIWKMHYYKSLNGFLMIQKQMTLKVYNV